MYRYKNTKTKNKNNYLALLIILPVLAIGLVLFRHYTSNKNLQKKSATDTTINQDSGAEPTQTGANVKDKPTDSSTPPTDTTPSQTSKLSIGNFSQSDGSVNATANITNASVSGKCYFTFTSSNTKPVASASNSVASGSNQTCSISINEAEFTKIGVWQLKTEFVAGSTSTESEINVTIK